MPAKAGYSAILYLRRRAKGFHSTILWFRCRAEVFFCAFYTFAGVRKGFIAPFYGLACLRRCKIVLCSGFARLQMEKWFGFLLLHVNGAVLQHCVLRLNTSGEVSLMNRMSRQSKISLS